MKKILCLLFFIFLFTSCKSNQKIKLEVASEIENQIQNIDEFRLDKIVLKATYANRNVQYMVLTEDMVEGFDTSKRGKTELVIKFMGEKIFLDFVLYDDEFLKENYIFYWYIDGTWVMRIRKSFFDLDQYGDQRYFYDSNFTTEIVSEPKEKIMRIYPLKKNPSMDFPLKVNFYERDCLVRSYHINYGDKIPYYTPDDEEFSGWDTNVEILLKENLDIHALYLPKDKVIAYIYDATNNYSHYEVYPKGISIEDIQLENTYSQIFMGWQEDLDILLENVELRPIYKKVYTVSFYSLDKELLYVDKVFFGEPATFICPDETKEAVDFSQDFSSVYGDLEIYVRLELKEEMYNYYYIEDRYYCKTLKGEPAPTLLQDTYYESKWVEFEENKFRLVDEERSKKIYITTLDDQLQYLYEKDKEFLDIPWWLIYQKNKLVLYEYFLDKECTQPASYDQDSFFLPLPISNSYLSVVYLFAKPVSVREGWIKQCEILTGAIIPRPEPFHHLTEQITYAYLEITGNFILGGYYNELYPNVNGIWLFENNLQYERICAIGAEITSIFGGIGADISKGRIYFIVDAANPKYYSRLGNLYDKESNERIYQYQGENI